MFNKKYVLLIIVRPFLFVINGIGKPFVANPSPFGVKRRGWYADQRWERIASNVVNHRCVRHQRLGLRDEAWWMPGTGLYFEVRAGQASLSPLRS